MKQHYLLTGVTGIIGSQVLYELLHIKLKHHTIGNIVVLIRSKSNITAKQRLVNLFQEVLVPDYLKAYHLDDLLQAITLLDIDIAQTTKLRKYFDSLDFKYKVIHLAASVNLASSEKAEKEIVDTNLNTTLSFLDAVGSNASKFCFISTAFASGHRNGLISDNFLERDFNKANFRNPYEECKAKVEHAIVDYCKDKLIDWQILRPSIVCGRMLDMPYYIANKYLVFYLVGAFLHRVSSSSMSDELLRIYWNKSSWGLNIVPVDYVSKTIVRAVDTSIKELNIVSSQNTPTQVIYTTLTQATGIKNWKLVDEFPEGKLTILEKLYYKNVGSQFNAYMNTPSHSFDTTNLRSLMSDISEPDVALGFKDLFNHAIQCNFSNVTTELI